MRHFWRRGQRLTKKKVQIVGGLFIIGLNIFMTSVIMAFIKYVLRIPLRMSEEHLEIGDDAVHGEEAYALFFEGQRSHVYGDMGPSMSAESRAGMQSGPILGMPPTKATSDEESNGHGGSKENGTSKQD